MPSFTSMRALILHWDLIHCQTLATLVKGVFAATEVMITQRARDALRLLAAAPVVVALMGVDAPDLDGLDFVPETIECRMAYHTIITCERSDSRTLSALRRLPISGMIDPSTADLDELRAALTEVASGRRYVSPSFKERFAGPGFPWHSNLSSQEEVVLAVLAEGLDNERAASRLGLSPQTVRSHRARIMGKLGVHHKGDLIAFALAHRYIRYTTCGLLHPGIERALEAVSPAKTRAARSWRAVA